MNRLARTILRCAAHSFRVGLRLQDFAGAQRPRVLAPILENHRRRLFRDHRGRVLVLPEVMVGITRHGNTKAPQSEQRSRSSPWSRDHLPSPSWRADGMEDGGADIPGRLASDAGISDGRPGQTSLGEYLASAGCSSVSAWCGSRGRDVGGPRRLRGNSALSMALARVSAERRAPAARGRPQIAGADGDGGNSMQGSPNFSDGGCTWNWMLARWRRIRACEDAELRRRDGERPAAA